MEKTKELTMAREETIEFKITDEATEVAQEFYSASVTSLRELERGFDSSGRRIEAMSGGLDTMAGKVNTLSNISNSFAAFSASSENLKVSFSEATDSFISGLEDMGFRWMELRDGFLSEETYASIMGNERLYYEESLLSAEDHQSRLNMITMEGWDSRLNLTGRAAGDLSNIMANLYKTTGSQNMAMFKVMKSFAVAEAVIQGYRAAQSAYAAGSAIGGPVMGAAFAAVAIAASTARIKQIQATNPGGAKSVSTGGGSAPRYKSFDESSIPERGGKEDLKTQSIVVNVHNPLSEGNWDVIGEDIIKSINKAGERNIALTIHSNEAN